MMRWTLLSRAGHRPEEANDALDSRAIGRDERNVDPLGQYRSIRLHHMPGKPGYTMVHVDVAGKLSGVPPFCSAIS